MYVFCSRFFVSWSVLLLSICCCNFMMLSLTYAQDSVYTVSDLDQYQNLKNPFVYNLVNALYQRAQTNDPNFKKKYLIQNFCDAILTDIVGEWFQYDQVFIINPRQSFFLYHLCRWVDAKYHDFFPILHPLVINQSSRDLPLKLKPQDVCHSTQANLWDCKISDIVSPLIKIIRDDLYRIKYASIQLYQGPTIPPENFIKSYARRFLTTDLPELSQWWYCNNLSYHYIYPESLSDHKSWFCSHPKVFKELTTISKGMSKLVKKNVIIDGVSEDMYLSDSYSDNPAESDYAKLCNIYVYPNAPDTTLRKRNTKYDMVRCAFTLNHQNANIWLQEHQKAQWSMQAFYNLEYSCIVFLFPITS